MLEAGDALTITEQRQQRNGENSLVPGDEPEEAALLHRLLRCEGKQRDVNVRVHIKMVRMGVVRIVLAHPPVITPTGEQAAADNADKGILPAAGKPLPVTCIMDDEGELHPDDA